MTFLSYASSHNKCVYGRYVAKTVRAAPCCKRVRLVVQQLAQEAEYQELLMCFPGQIRKRRVPWDDRKWDHIPVVCADAIPVQDTS